MMLFPIRYQLAWTRWTQAGALVLAGTLVAGCGAGYRPVISPINPTGPPAQPNSLVAVVSAPSPTTAGIATIIDYSGDTIVAQSPIGPGPLAFTIDETGSNGYTVNSDGTLTNFPVASSLQQKQVQYTTLPTSAQTLNMFSPSTGLWISDLNGNVTDVLNGIPATFKLAVPVAPTPLMVIGPTVIAQRNYVIAENITDPTGMACNVSPRTVGSAGEADAIELATYTVSARIPLGKCPVYGLETPDNQRVFVLNRGDDTITVINSKNNILDACTPFLNQSGQLVTCHPSLPLSTSAGLTGANVPAIAGSVYAEYNVATSQLVVADYDGGTISVIDVSLDQYGNDSATFGTTFTIPVGNTATPNPTAVTVLYDGSRAYTANQNDDPTGNGTGSGTVSIVNLSSHTLEKTVAVTGHPRTVASTQNSLYGKVYAAAPDSPYLSIIRTDQDIIDTTVLTEGNVVDVRVTTQNGSTGNPNVTSRRPGYGEPCYLSAQQLTAAGFSPPTLAQCQLQTP
jgi:DNA-binding beta-propeller fold protein YncE